MKELHISSGFFIEFGGWDGIYLSNCRNLYENGWSGCFIEADKNKYNELVNNYSGSNIICLNEMVYPTEKEGNTVDSLHKKYMNSVEVDLLSIDIDGRDYEIFENLTVKPKLIIIEGGFLYNPLLKTKIPYEEAQKNAQQPLYVMTELAKEKGYTPIAFNQDTFLLRNDLYEQYPYFKTIKNDCYSLWKSAFYHIFAEDERQWLINYRLQNNITLKYEHPYYLDTIHSIENAFDIVIPIGPLDAEFVKTQIEYTKKNIIGYRHIYLVCYDPSISINGCINIDERIFPFTINTVKEYHGELSRNGWYLQQLIKLYAGLYIPNILDKYLVVDADTLFLKPTTFVHDNKCLYNFSPEHHDPYFEHMSKLHPNLVKMSNVSGICHHMIFEVKYVKELFELVESTHNDIFYNVFLKLVTNTSESGASEYEIYFNYILQNHNENILIRKLEWENVSNLDAQYNLDYISYHHHNR
jgi:hypothetical protein